MIQKIFEIEWDTKLAREKDKGREIVYHDEIKDDKIYKKYTFDCIKRYYDKFYVTGIETSFDSCKTEEIVEPDNPGEFSAGSSQIGEDGSDQTFVQPLST